MRFGAAATFKRNASLTPRKNKTQYFRLQLSDSEFARVRAERELQTLWETDRYYHSLSSCLSKNIRTSWLLDDVCIKDKCNRPTPTALLLTIYTAHVTKCLSALVTNQRPVLWSRDLCWPTTAQCSAPLNLALTSRGLQPQIETWAQADNMGESGAGQVSGASERHSYYG